MKAIVCTRLGLPEAIEYKEVTKPVPEDDQVLVEVHASSVTFSNMILVNRNMLLLRLMVGSKLMSKSRIPGTDMAGRVTEVGKDVKQFRPGDEVYGDLFGANKGAYAEYVCAPENVLALKPANITFEEAAVVPESAIVALQGLRGRVAKGQKVLVIGASGGIGTFAVQIAKYYGAEVTGVCGPRNLDLVRSLGADYVIDYSKEDFTRSSQKVDLIFAARKSRSIYDIRRALKPGGIYVSAGGPSVKRLFQEFIIGPRVFKKQGKKIAVINISIKQEDLDFIRKLIEASKIKPVIDRSYPLSETAEAFRYYAKGHARGKVAITIGK
ncbi:MAG: NAD(P)-dependent alcohol dehydrogenase [Dehalococcoidales bacterium]